VFGLALGLLAGLAFDLPLLPVMAVGVAVGQLLFVCLIPRLSPMPFWLKIVGWTLTVAVLSTLVGIWLDATWYVNLILSGICALGGACFGVVADLCERHGQCR
jgi:hypothetical protein